MGKQNTSFKFEALQPYISYLLQNLMKEVSSEYLQLIRKENLPLLKLFIHLDEKSIQESILKSLQEFFEQIINNTALAQAYKTIDKWKANELPGIPRDKIAGEDIIIVYGVRRKLLLKFLPYYTQNCHQIVEIMNEVEEYYILLEKYSLKTFTEIQLEEINKRNEFLSSLVNNSEDGISVYDTNLNVLEWNPALEKHNGLKKENILGKNFFELYPFYKNKEEARAIEKVLQGEKVYLTDKQYKIKEGWFDAYLIPLYEDEKITGILSIVRDITKRKANEDKLKQQQKELEAANLILIEQKEEIKSANEELQENLTLLEKAREEMLENERRLLEAQSVAHLGSWEYDVVTEKIYWSDEMKRIYGFDAQDPNPDFLTFLELIHPEDRELVKNTFAQTFQTFKPYSFEHRIITKDGSLKWLLANGYPTIADNQVINLKGTGHDITERKYAELKIIEEQYFINKIADTTPDVLTVYDLQEKKNIYYNRELYEVLEYNQEEIQEIRKLGQAFLKEIIHPDDLKKIIDFFESYSHYTENIPREIEYRIKSKKGRYKWIMSRYNVFKRSDKGLPIQIIGISRDITEKKEIDEKIRQNERKLKESQSLAKMGHWELDIKNYRIQWSDGLYEVYGIPKNQNLHFQDVATYVVPEDFKKLQEKIKSAIEEGLNYSMEYRILNSQGKIKTLFTKGEPVKDQKGKTVLLRGITQDITERKLIENELKESRKFIEIITDSVPNVIYLYDIINRKNIYSNREIIASLGYSPEELKQFSDIINLVHPDDKSLILERDEKIKNGSADETYEVYFRVKHANRNYRWLRSLSKIFKYNGEGDPWLLLGVIEDVTEKKIAEEKLKTAYQSLQEANEELSQTQKLLTETNIELEQRVQERTKELISNIKKLNIAAEEQQKFTALVENSIDFISMADMEGKMIYVNKGGLKLLGLENINQINRLSVMDFVAEEDFSFARKEILPILSEQRQWNGELHYRNFTTGASVPLYSNLFQIFDPKTGSPLVWANISHDLSEQKRKEQEIKNSREKLAEINQELNAKNEELLRTNIDLDNFIYTASHDLKAPISNLEGLLILLTASLETKFIDQDRKIIEMIHRSIIKLKETIGALVEITKAQKNLEESKEIISFKEVVEDVITEIEEMFIASEASIELDLHVDTVKYAKVNLTSIIYNLLSNAIKYRSLDRPLKIKVKTYKDDNFLILTISDNGLGINYNQQSKLFTMFKRLHSHVEGTGIGLYIIKRIVENNQGKIEVESEEGKGTTFKVYLGPIVKERQKVKTL
ncbi:hypothetical protein BH23BAC1_BH23BAC1_02560 [soil metagenome]